MEIKNVAAPDETRPVADKGSAAVMNVAGHPVLYGTFEPGRVAVDFGGYARYAKG